MSMIKLSSGVEISEDTVVAALKKAGIETKSKHIFKAGDVAKKEDSVWGDNWRFIVEFRGKLYSFNSDGAFMSEGQEKFERENYQYVGKQRDLLKK